MKSLWREETGCFPRKTLDKTIKTDVCIIGAGIAGILLGYELKQRGIRCVILEADTVLSGVTQNTTAKITSQHNLIYDKLMQNYGVRGASQYARANEQAIDRYEAIIKEHDIDCDFKRLPSYVYSTKETTILRREQKAAQRAGIRAELERGIDLPVGAVCALKFPNQAQFQPLKFLKPLSEMLEIYENTLVTAVKEGCFTTSEGYRILARHYVITTHFPFMNSIGHYYMRMHQERSYVIAYKNAKQLDFTAIDHSADGFSFRSHGDYLLVGGSAHRTGAEYAKGAYDKINTFTKNAFPEAEEVCRWSAQDCMTHDQVPFIGKYSPLVDNVLVATGFNKWGMTTAMAASRILADRIEGIPNSSAAIFSPQRSNLKANIGGILKDSKFTMKGIAIKNITLPETTIRDIPGGHGGVIRYKGKRVGVYKNETGKVYMVDTTCPHLKCQLEWNPNENSWDCPCHGSRFNYKGELLDGPAQIDLKRYR